MDVLNKLTGSGNDVAQFLVEEDLHQDLDEDNEDYKDYKKSNQISMN